MEELEELFVPYPETILLHDLGCKPICILEKCAYDKILYQQAFDWFRINHNLLSYTEDFYSEPNKKVYRNCIAGITGSILHETYEIARLSRLNALINHINKQNF